MQITSVSKDKQHQLKVTFQNGDVMLVDADVCAENGIKVGLTLCDEEINSLKHTSDLRRAKSRALWYLDRMDYTEKKLFEKLLKAGFRKEICAETLAYLCEFSLVDDKRYAERLAERYRESNVSKREAVNKLYLKGVPLSLAKQVCVCFETDETDTVKNLIKEKYAAKLSAENGSQKVFAALIRKGFSYQSVREAMKSYIEESEFSEEY